MKKLLTVLLSLCVLACFTLTLTACGTKEGAPSEGLKYTKIGEEYCVTGIGMCTDTDIVIPAEYDGLPVTKIYDMAFVGCSYLTSVVIPDSVTSIGSGAFGGCTSLTSIITSENNTKYSSVDGILYNKKQTEFIHIPKAISGSVTIPNTITSIDNYAFSECRSLISVTIGSGVTKIGSYAFDGCIKLVEVINKSSLNITKGSKYYGYVGYYALNVKTEGESEVVNQNGYLFYAYDGTNYLLGYVGKDKDLTLPNFYYGETYEIYKNAFHNCSLLTSIVIPDSVTSIGYYAFEYCTSLTSITIGSGVTSIGYGAFDGCTRLTSVYYKGTASDWNKMYISYDSYYLTNATRYYYSATEPNKTGNYWHYVNGVPTVW